MNEKLKKIMAEALELPEEKINENSNDKNTDNWDSIHILTMIVLIERRFKISIPENQLVNFISYKTIETIVNGECSRSNKAF